MIPGCRTLFDEGLFLRRLTDEARRTGKPVNCHTITAEINAMIDDPTEHVTANSIHMRLWRLDIPHTMEVPAPTPTPTSQDASQTDLIDLADMHKRAFNRLRALEGKVSAIQEENERYARRVLEWMGNVVSSLQCIDRNGQHPNFSRLVNHIEDTLPHLKHIHVYLWGAQTGLPSGVGKCACGSVISHPQRGTDNALYKHSIGSTANRSRGRGRDVRDWGKGGY